MKIFKKHNTDFEISNALVYITPCLTNLGPYDAKLKLPYPRAAEQSKH